MDSLELKIAATDFLTNFKKKLDVIIEARKKVTLAWYAAHYEQVRNKEISVEETGRQLTDIALKEIEPIQEELIRASYAMLGTFVEMPFEMYKQMVVRQDSLQVEAVIEGDKIVREAVLKFLEEREEGVD